MVNYYLDYRTSETGRHPERLGLLVNYCLDCGTSKTLWHRSCPDCEMGYYLGYRTSETRI
mgnify:FL=1